jgi:hypothetical protein
LSENPILDITDPSIADLVYTKTNVGGWFFDAFLKSTHTSRLTITQHPVQTGSAITDHAFLEPRELTMDIGMSNVATSFVNGQFSGGYSRSVQAFKILKSLQQSRIPVQIHTRLNLYENMLVETITAPDDYRSLDALHCTVTFREILVATVSTVNISAKPLVTDGTSRGQAQPTNPGAGQTTTFTTLLTGP